MDEEKKEPVTEETPEMTEDRPEETSGPAPEEAPAEEPEKKEERKFFKKKEKKKDERDEKIGELTDRLQRLMAEFDNFRKRTEKEKSERFDLGVMSVVEKILPVVDSFERGLASVPEDKREDSVYVGMKLIYDQLMKTLTDLGVTPMEAEGKEFDPNLHNAVLQVENEELTPGTVAAELQKGYLYKGTVLRHAMVSVVSE